jgi:hypothetical protein
MAEGTSISRVRETRTCMVRIMGAREYKSGKERI